MITCRPRGSNWRVHLARLCSSLSLKAAACRLGCKWSTKMPPMLPTALSTALLNFFTPLSPVGYQHMPALHPCNCIATLLLWCTWQVQLCELTLLPSAESGVAVLYLAKHGLYKTAPHKPEYHSCSLVCWLGWTLATSFLVCKKDTPVG